LLVLPLAGLLAALASFAAEATSCAGVQSLLTATKQAFEREDLALAERTALKVHEKSPQCNEVLLWAKFAKLRAMSYPPNLFSHATR
jgi:hypothetical protein